MSNAMRKKAGLRRGRERAEVMGDAVIYCEGKHGYPTMAAAMAMSKYGNKPDSGPRLKPYHCPKCGQYHRGNSIGQKRRKARADEARRHKWDDEVY